MLGGHVRAVFTLVTFIFIFCVTATITSFREIPLWKLEATMPIVGADDDDDSDRKVEDRNGNPENQKISEPPLHETDDVLDKMTKTTSYGSLGQNGALEVPVDHVSTN